MLVKIFILFAIFAPFVTAQEDDSACLEGLSNCTETYSSHIGDIETLYQYYTCVVGVNICSETEEQVYQQPILDAVLDTMRQIQAEEKNQESFVSGCSSLNTRHTLLVLSLLCVDVWAGVFLI